ncbi:MAG: hypothetical protein AB1512_05870 [Thermodesulfobacteriota bacterium]
MEEEHIARLFMDAAKHSAQKTDDVRRVFSLLVGSALRYRDHVLASSGRIVTVGDVREALKRLVPALATGQIPETDNQLSLGLLKIWLDELSTLGYPRIQF